VGFVHPHCRFAPFLLAAWLCAASGCNIVANGKNAEGVSALEQGNTQLALQRFQEALDNDPKNADAAYNLACVYHQMGVAQNNQQMTRQAEDLYNRCLNHAPDHTECHRGLAVLLAKTGRSESAFTLLQRWALRRPDLAAPRVELARLYEEYGDKESARQQLYEAVGIDVNDKRAWNALAALQEQTGELAQAMTNYQRSLAIDPYQGAVTARVATLQSKLGAGVGPPVSAPGNRWAAQPSPLPR
jgi:Tfp pilus assembly protein PilF